MFRSISVLFLQLWLLGVSVNLTQGDDHGTAAAAASDTVPDTYCLTLHQDLLRRQADEWGRTEPFTIDDGTKHTPFISFDSEARQATVIVGNGEVVGGVYHPMVSSDNPTTVHFIMFIWLVDQNQQVFATKTLDPTMPAPATVVFDDIPTTVSEITAFEFCNLHGVWMGPTIRIMNSTEQELLVDGNNDAATAASPLVDTPEEDMYDDNNLVCNVDSPLAVAYESYAADFVRRQSLPPFNSLQPFDEDDGTKHVPYIQINNNGTATVTVGTEGNYHVMFGAAASGLMAGDGYESTEDDEPHWITDIYVYDQNGDIVIMSSLNPTYVDIAQITFDIPSSATILQAFEWCNVHGLYIGPAVSVESGEIVESVSTATATTSTTTEGTTDGSFASSVKGTHMYITAILLAAILL